MNDVMKNEMKPFFLWGGAILLGVLCFVFFPSCEENSTKESIKEVTMDDMRGIIKDQVDEELSKPSSELRRRVEKAHGTVNVTSASLTKLSINTIDGTERVGEKGSNIASLDMELTFYWDGVFHKNGYTVLYLSLDSQNGQVIESKIIRTSAVVNIEDPAFWTDVAGAAAFLLL